MKITTKSVAAFAILLCMQVPINAYRFTFINETGHDLLLMIYSNDQKQYHVINNNKSHTFNNENWKPHSCLTEAKAIRGESLYSPHIYAYTIVFAKNGPFCRDTTFVLTQDKQGNVIATEKQLKNIVPDAPG